MFLFDIAKRFKNSRHQDKYIRFISGSSTTGIALGCAVLIILLSVMNGFEKELRQNLLRSVPHAEIFAIDDKGIYPNQRFIETIQNDPMVDQVFTLNKSIGLLQHGAVTKAVSIVGVSQAYTDTKFPNIVDYQSLLSDENAIILGVQIIKQLGLSIGDEIQLLLPAVTNDLSFSAPKSTWVKVISSVSVGGDFDKQIAIVSPSLLSKLLDLDANVTHIELFLNDPFMARELVIKYGYMFDQAAYMSDWTRTNGHLYQDIQLIRVVVYIVLTLVISVASFNIVSSLVMSVKEKSKEIAILKTIGLNNQNIAKIFVIKGLYHGSKGCLIGAISGSVIAFYLPQIIVFIEWIFAIKLMPSDVYFTTAIPSQLKWQDVGLTVFLTLIICCLATVYPAKKAAGVMPADSLS